MNYLGAIFRIQSREDKKRSILNTVQIHDHKEADFSDSGSKQAKK